MPPLFAIAQLLPLVSASTTCTSDVQAVYGDATAGSAGFAELLGVVCAGPCYERVSLWSSIARAHGNVALASASACRDVCVATASCEVFTFTAQSECYLQRQMSATSVPALSSVADSTSALTCVIEHAGGVHDYGTQSIACCAALENATAAVASGTATYTDPRLCSEAGCAEALRRVLSSSVPDSVCTRMASCPTGWTARGLSCYRKSRTQATTSRGCTQACASLEADSYPVCITDAPEADFLHISFPTGYYWVPLFQDASATNQNEGWNNWAPGANGQTCTSTYRRWSRGEPNWYSEAGGAGSAREDCAISNYMETGFWYDAPCAMSAACVCEIDLANASPSQPPTPPPTSNAPPTTPPPPPPPPTAVATPMLSGPVVCGEPWLRFPDGLLSEMSANAVTAAVTANAQCAQAGRAYGAADGACASAPLLSIYAPQKTIDRGAAAGWFRNAIIGGASVHTVPDDWRALSAESCSRRCEADSACGGYTLSYGVCQLRARISGCDEVLGRVALRPEPDELLGGQYATVGGAKGCAAGSDRVPYSWYDECSGARCTSPDITGALFAGSVLRPQSGCWYAITGGDETFDLLRGRWVVTSGGSNLLLTVMALANLITPELLGPRFTGQQTGGTDVLDIVWTRGTTGEVKHRRVECAQPRATHDACRRQLMSLSRALRSSCPRLCTIPLQSLVLADAVARALRAPAGAPMSSTRSVAC